MLNHEGLQVRQNTKAADALRRDRKREEADRLTCTKSTTTEGETDTQAETLVETDRCPEAAIYRRAYGRQCDG